MNASFGVDHPLLATHDINALRDLFIALGFNMTTIGKHPWGTNTSLAMFEGCLIEIMGIYDDSLIDEVPAGEFLFGRHVFENLQKREGVALTALHSTNSKHDAQYAQSKRFSVAGHLEFGRDVALPDGTYGRTKTTLALLPDKQFPRLSFFLCQQHRPELIYVPTWLQHPNEVSGIRGINIVAKEVHHAALKKKFSGLYDICEEIIGGFQFKTANGVIRVLHKVGFEQAVGPLAAPIVQELLPCIAGIDLELPKTATLIDRLKAMGLDYREVKNGIVLSSPEITANTTLRFLVK